MTQIQTKSEWHKTVGKNIVVFSFIKKGNGELRKMIGCHDFAWMPTSSRPKGDSVVTDNPNIVRIYDLEKNGWRSFDLTTLEAVHSIIPTNTGKLANNQTEKLRIYGELEAIQEERKKLNEKAAELRKLLKLL